MPKLQLAQLGKYIQPRLLAWLALALSVIGLDQLTKAWIVAVFAYGDGVVVTGFFNVLHVVNHGAAFSFLAGAGGWQRWFFVALAFVISAWLITMLRQHQDERLLPTAFALILGGAIGNVVDRVARGAVVDFLDFHAFGYHWPAFNVADCGIVVGVGLMVWAQLFHVTKRDDEGKN